MKSRLSRKYSELDAVPVVSPGFSSRRCGTSAAASVGHPLEEFDFYFDFVVEEVASLGVIEGL